jgi:hypothetical protein
MQMESKYCGFINLFKDNEEGVLVQARHPIEYNMLSYYLEATLAHYPRLHTVAIFKIKLNQIK